MISVENVMSVPNRFGSSKNSDIEKSSSVPVQTEVSETNAKVLALEKNILFLKSKQEALLNGLQKEIEALRKENKELQFRLVMCCCSAVTKQKDGVFDERLEQHRRQHMEHELNILKDELAKERERNAHLMKQIEEANAANAGQPTLTSPRPHSTSMKARSAEPTKAGGAVGWVDAQRSVPIKPLRPTESEDYQKLGRFSPSSSGVEKGSLTRQCGPKTSPRILTTAPDGLWVRPQQQDATVNSTEADAAGLQPSAGKSSQMKLPVLKGYKTNQTNNAACLSNSSLCSSTGQLTSSISRGKFNLDPSVSPMHIETRPMRAFSSSRSSFGPTRLSHFGLPLSPPGDTISVSSSTGNIHPPSSNGPFLPALHPPTELTEALRQKRARALQRKRLYREQNFS